MRKFWIPSNFKEPQKFRGIPIRNIIEGGVCAFLLYKLIMLTPFVPTIKLYACIFICGGVLAVGIIGIRGESVLQFLNAYRIYKQRKRVLHLEEVKKIEVEEDEKNGKKKHKANIKERAGRKTK